MLIFAIEYRHFHLTIISKLNCRRIFQLNFPVNKSRWKFCAHWTLAQPHALQTALNRTAQNVRLVKRGAYMFHCLLYKNQPRIVYSSVISILCYFHLIRMNRYQFERNSDVKYTKCNVYFRFCFPDSLFLSNTCTYLI